MHVDIPCLNHGSIVCVFSDANITNNIVLYVISCVVDEQEVDSRFKMKVELYNEILKEIKSFTGPGRTCSKYLQEKFPRYGIRRNIAFLMLCCESN